jgi:N12 class adenine-specific DNA methylase
LQKNKKKQKMKKLLSIIIIGLLLSVNAYSMTQNQMFIIQQTLNVDQGKVTKQMHKDFWKDVPNKDDVVEFMETTGLMAKISRDGMQYQMELWKSALISYQNKQVFKSDDYLKVREVMNDFIYRVSKNIPDANERLQVTNQMRTSMINSDNLLKSAAARTAMQSVQGPIIELSEERIIQVINNIEKSFSRIDKLLSIEWKD